MIEGINPKGLQTAQIDLLNIQGRRFHDDLILVIVLEPIGILPVTAIRRTTGRFNIGHPPRFRAKNLEKRSRVKGPRADFRTIGLLDDTSLICPESLE
jgi:hypothetical protein